MLVVGSGAGLRAAIEASTSGVSVGLVCSRCSARHTRDGQAGSPRQLANVDRHDSWKVFAIRCAGRYINWRMARCTPRSPLASRALEAWGPSSTTRTAAFCSGISAATSTRLAWRPRAPELIRTLRNGVHRGIGVHVVRGHPLLLDGGRIALAYSERGRWTVFRGKSDHPGSSGIGKAYKITSNSGNTGDGHTLAYDAGSPNHRHESCSSIRLAWSGAERQGILVTEGVRGEGGCWNKAGGGSCSAVSDNYKPSTTRTEEGFTLCAGRSTRADARRPPEALTRATSHGQSSARSARAAASARQVFLEQTFASGSANGRDRSIPSTGRRSCEHVPPVQGLGGLDITNNRWSGADDALCHGGVRVDMIRKCRVFPACSRAANARGHQQGKPAGQQPLSDLLIAASAGEYAAKFSRDNPTATVATTRWMPRRGGRSNRSNDLRARTRSRFSTTCRT